MWGYLYEALEVAGRHLVKLLLTPTFSQDVREVFLKQIAESDPQSVYVVIIDQAGFQMKE
jgi:transposase-like protein